MKNILMTSLLISLSVTAFTVASEPEHRPFDSPPPTELTELTKKAYITAPNIVAETSQEIVAEIASIKVFVANAPLTEIYSHPMFVIKRHRHEGSMLIFDPSRHERMTRMVGHTPTIKNELYTPLPFVNSERTRLRFIYRQ